MISDQKSIEERLKGYIESAKNIRLDIEVGDLAGKHLIYDLDMDSLDIMNILLGPASHDTHGIPDRHFLL